MDIDSCFELGHVIKNHGIKGELLVFLDVDDPVKYEKLDSVFIEINHKLVPFFIEQFKLQGSNAIVKFEDVNDIERARELAATRMFLPLEQLPDLGKDNFYLHEIIGFTVIDETAGRLGEIKTIYEANGNRLAGMDYREREVLVPLNKDFIRKLDKKKKEVFMALPDGLLDI